ncbi:anti-sigma factor family protein [Candidatus Laterigemmans baculatus]|uniref:anti-sigma factor family protein n=1 Tax=Candidatus Laterigemmans baculatus TaxID=2770505 RepID=UPI0013D98D04|nr:hypothetical protein [Candidatus Laterigemmans baculatus]
MLGTHDDDAPVAEIDETLVAYLDGELSESERQRLEDRLVREADLRRRLTELQSGWEMLDHLPPAHVTHDFARTTLEMVAASTSQALEVQRQQRPWRLLSRVLLIALATLLMAAAGFALVESLERLRYHRQLADLPLAEHLDAYQAEVDLELMQQLAEDPQWNEAMQLAADAGGLVVPVSLGLAEMGREERAAALPRLDPADRRRLTSQWERLQLLTPEQLTNVRRRAAAVQEQPRPDVVLRTMKEYASWFASLPPEKQERIVTAEDPRGAILEEVQQSALGWVQNYGLVLGENDRELIYEALKVIARDRLAWADEHDVWSDRRLGFLKDLRDRYRRAGSEESSLTPEEFLLGAMAARVSLRRGTPGEGERRAPPEAGPEKEPEKQPEENSEEISEDGSGRRPWTVLFGPPTAEELAAIEGVISNKALLILDAASGSAEERREALWRWCVVIIRSRSPATNSPEGMLNRYLAMEPDERELLDLQPPGEIFDELGDRRRNRFGGGRP